MQLASEEPEPPSDSSSLVEIQADGMSATLVVGADNVSADCLREALAKANVVFGVDDQELMRVASAGVPNMCVIARGQNPISGRDAIINYDFRIGIFKPVPTVGPDGKVDYFELGAVENVMPGQILATKEPAIHGSPGTTVTGKVIPVNPVSDIPLKSGSGTELSADGRKILAKIEGRPLLAAGHVVVSPVFHVPGDLDLTLGNLDFLGSVGVDKDVNDQISIRARDNILVRGTVAGARMRAGGDIVVGGGVLHDAHASANGNVCVTFAEHSRLEAGSRVVVKASLLFCDVVAGTDVMVGKAIIGGRIRAFAAIEAATLGNRGETNTELELKPKETLQALISSGHERLRAVLKEIVAVVQEPQNSGASTPKPPVPKTAEEVASLRLEATAVQRQIKEAEEKLATMPGPVIIARDCLYPGVQVCMNDARAVSLARHLRIRLRESRGRIHYSVGGPYLPTKIGEAKWRLEVAKVDQGAADPESSGDEVERDEAQNEKIIQDFERELLEKGDAMAAKEREVEAAQVRIGELEARLRKLEDR